MNTKVLKLKNTTARLAKHPDQNFPHNVEENLRIASEDIERSQDKLQDDSCLVEVLHLSVDPTMRVWMTGQKTYIGRVNIGDVFPSLGVVRIVLSNSPKFKVGDLAVGMVGFQNYAEVSAKVLTPVPKNHPNPQNFLGVLGINGLTAYVGLMDIGKPKKGETVVISTAAGSVGEIAVQIAKYQGCHVVGIAGGKDKCDYVVNTLGADSCIDYKSLIHDEKALIKELMKQCPRGIDVYFDNVGGRILDCVLSLINKHARIIACGAISVYNFAGDTKNTPEELRIRNYPNLITKNASMEGFLYFDHKQSLKTGLQTLMTMMKEGKLKYNEDVTYGLENAHQAFKKLFTGKNTGKTIVSVKAEQPKPKL